MGFAIEDRLLMLCSRVSVSDETMIEVAHLLSLSIDWKYLLETSVRHNVAPLFYYGLQQVSQSTKPIAQIPASVLGELQDLYRVNSSRNQRLYAVLKEIIQEFSKAKVPLMGLKDIQLAQDVYPDPGVRPMGDLDLLIHQEDYDHAAQCMRRLGFIPLPYADIPYTLKYAWAHHWQRPGDNIWVDLQWNILQLEWDCYGEGSFNFEIERTWQHATQMTIEDQDILVPGLEDMLFHLVLHLEGHHYAEWILFCDIAEFIHHYQDHLNWQYLISLAHRYRVESSFYYVFLYIKNIMDVEFPTYVWKELYPVYFTANLNQPIFGNLTHLHVSLDEIQHSVQPPRSAMREFETIVRLQAFGAMQFFREIDLLASSFINHGGELIIINGTSSARIVPDPLLKPFEEIQVFINKDNLQPMRQEMSVSGFEVNNGKDPDSLTKAWETSSRDPILSGIPIRINLEVNFTTDLAGLLAHHSERLKNKNRIAFGLLLDKFLGRKAISRNITLPLRIVSLSPEELLIYLATRLGNQKQDRLFALNSLLEFFRGYTGPIDWQQVAFKARRLGVSNEVEEGLSIASEMLDHIQLPPEVLSTGSNPISHSKVLTLARYGPESLGLYSGFKPLFYYFLTLFAIHGFSAKLNYIFISIIGNKEKKPILFPLIFTAGKNLLSFIHRKQKPTLNDMVFWVETSPKTGIVSITDQPR